MKPVAIAAIDPGAPDQQLSTVALVQAIRQHTTLPVVAAGGVMDGAGIATMMKLGASGVQLGTAFVLCPESAASAAYRRALLAAGERGTVMTAAISGRQARCVRNAFCELCHDVTPEEIPDYPLTYALGKARRLLLRRTARTALVPNGPVRAWRGARAAGGTAGGDAGCWWQQA